MAIVTLAGAAGDGVSTSRLLFSFSLGYVGFEFHFGLSRTVGFVLCRVHGVFEQFFVVFACFPLFFVHQLAILVECVRIVVLRVPFEEFASFGFRFLDNFGSQRTWQTSGFT